MGNRFCVWIDRCLTPINYDGYSIILKRPKQIGDEVKIRTKSGHERVVKLFKSESMIKNAHYLVDVENKEAWPYDMPEVRG